MIPSDRAFNGKRFYEYDGKTFYRWYHLEKLGEYQVRLKIISTKSNNLQGIAMFFSDFKGSISLNGENIQILKGFKHYVFKDGQFPNNEMLFVVHAKSGHLLFNNASQEGEFFSCGAFGCAFWIENIAENHLRFHCNDHEYDDDFDDLIFDMVITAL